jgi:hypothetical protein
MKSLIAALLLCVGLSAEECHVIKQESVSNGLHGRVDGDQVRVHETTKLVYTVKTSQHVYRVSLVPTFSWHAPRLDLGTVECHADSKYMFVDIAGKNRKFTILDAE